jgi:lambda repressor-like predicted transcriptional regulator|tara:strand:- start:13 stop:192 length:180 start_codon:yes stop_codon:yes gene_type:complete
LKKSDLSQIKKQLKNKSISMGELSRHTKVSEYILNKWFDGRTNLEVSAYRRVRAFLSKN